MARFITAIVLGETSPSDPHVKLLEHFFRGISVQVTTNMGDLREVVQHYATHSDPQIPVLFIQDSSIIDTSPATFHSEITNALQHAWDICYFGGHSDRCHQQITLTDRLSITNTIQGHQAVLYRPVPLRGIAAEVKGEKKISYAEQLSDMLADNKYRAVVRHPHLVHFDRNLARSHDDLARSNSCIPVYHGTPDTSSAWWTIIIVVIIVLLIIVVGILWHRGMRVNDPAYNSSPGSLRVSQSTHYSN